MKKLFLVMAVAVFAADGRHHSDTNQAETFIGGITDHGEDHDPQFSATNQAQPFLTYRADQDEELDSLFVATENNPERTLDMANNDIQLKEVEKEQQGRKLRRSRCKARNSCVVMGGFCVTNATDCAGRLIPEGCKRPGCQCCVPGTIEAKFDRLEMDIKYLKESMNNSDINLNTQLQSLKDSMENSNSNLNSEIQSIKLNINNSDSNLNTELQLLKNSMANSNSEMESIKDNINSSNTNLNSELQTLRRTMDNSSSNLNSEMQILKININNSDSNLNSELQSLKDNTNNMKSDLSSKLNSMNTNFNTKFDSLPEYEGCPKGFFELADQCFKFFDDTRLSWTASKSKCQSEGLLLAKPYDPLQLYSYLSMRYGNKQAWIGARGKGSSVQWDRDGQTISSSNPMWYSGHPGSRTSSSYCLRLMSHENYLKAYPTTPYTMNSCTSSYWALCEYLKE